MAEKGKPKNKSTRGNWSTKKKSPGPRASTNGGPGGTFDQTHWRRRMREDKLKFDDEAKQRFLDHFSHNGRLTAAAHAADITYHTVKNHFENDPEFYSAFQEAKELYRDRVYSHHQNLLFDGVDEPIVGGKFKDMIVAYKKVYPIPLIQMELRKVDPEYKERTEVDMNVNGGVLVVPGEVSPEDWAKKYGKAKPDSDEGDQ